MPITPRARDGGIDLHARLQLPHTLTHHGLDWLVTATRGVRVHTDDQADRAVRGMGADALTVGDDIFMRAGRFDPATPRGLALLSHELVHVVQQREMGGALSAPGPARDAHEGEALGVEHRVLALLQPARPAAIVGASRSPGRSAHHAALTGPPPPTVANAVPFRADEDRPAQAATAEGPATDPAELAGDVFRMLQRRLRIERERMGLGAA